MERADKKSSALDKEQLDEVVGGEAVDAACPRCKMTGCLTVNYSQKIINGQLTDIRVVDCSYCWYHKEIPLY